MDAPRRHSPLNGLRRVEHPDAPIAAWVGWGDRFVCFEAYGGQFFGSAQEIEEAYAYDPELIPDAGELEDWIASMPRYLAEERQVNRYCDRLYGKCDGADRATGRRQAGDSRAASRRGAGRPRARGAGRPAGRRRTSTSRAGPSDPEDPEPAGGRLHAHDVERGRRS
jgi:hypothetical protein